MFSSTFIWLVCLGGAFAVDISMNIQLGSESVSDSCDEQETITASSEEELRDKLTKKLESVLMKNPDAEITISTQINVNGRIHSTKITNSDITSTTDRAIATSKENVATTVALPTTGDIPDYTMDDVMTEFNTRSVTSIAPSTFESNTPLGDHSTVTEMITNEQEETTTNVVTTDSTEAEATTQDATTEPKNEMITDEQKKTTTNVGTTDSTKAEATTQDAIIEQRNCDVTYDSKCFNIFVFGKKNVSFKDAKHLCGNDKLANIYDLDHFNMILDFVRSKIPSGLTWVNVWTGLTYKNNILGSSSVEYKFPALGIGLPSFLSHDVSYTNVAFEVAKDPEDNQGIFNYPPSRSFHGAICETT
ncbi:uncharacterized protein LOC120341083 [Styela clava]